MTSMSIAPPPPAFHMLLFVAGEEHHSQAARANLQKIRECCLSDKSQIEVVDVLEDYRKALEWRVLLTPTLLVVSPRPVLRIIGTLEDTGRVLAVLQSKSEATAA